MPRPSLPDQTHFDWVESQWAHSKVKDTCPETQPGDLWLIGPHRLLCGDAAKPEDVDYLLDGHTIQLVFTDPPYNAKVKPRSNIALMRPNNELTGSQVFTKLSQGARPSKRAEKARDRCLVSDSMSNDSYTYHLRLWFGQMCRVLDPGCSFYLWGGFTNCRNYIEAIEAVGLHFHQAIIWVKSYPSCTKTDFMLDHEWCFYGWKKGAAHRFFAAKSVTDTWRVKKVDPRHMLHLTQKPVELARRAMLYSSLEGESVLDLFAGSGGTLAAGDELNRTCYLMEIDPHYCDVIINRCRAMGLPCKKSAPEL